MRNEGRSRGVALACVLLIGALCGVLLSALAGQEHYDYDALGRLIRVIDEQGRATEYVYDPAGNILQVITGETAQPPAITGISPNSLRRGETKQVQVTGTGLNGIEISSPDPQLTVTDLQSTPTQASFTLSASVTAILGPQQLTFFNAAGSIAATVTVNPVLPKVTVAPLPLAIPPDNLAHQFTVELSNADTIDHTFTLTSANTAIATVSPATLTIPAGQTTAKPSVTGKAAGQTSISLVSSILGTTAVPVFVTTEFTGINTSYAALVGVVKQAPAAPPASFTVSGLLSPVLGVAYGNYIKGLSPSALAIGTGPMPVVISGAGLQSATAVSVVPSDGLTIGTFSASADGTSLTVPITVAANAPTTTRQVVVTGAGGMRFPPATPTADRLLIGFPPPVVTSVEPLYGTPGTSVMTLIVRGQNFQNAQPILITPSDGFTIGVPSVSADGTQLTTGIGVSPAAPLGAKVVQVQTPGGISDGTPSPSNTFTLVNEIQQSFTPIVAPQVGVVKETIAAPNNQTYGLFSSYVGVALGSTVSAISPSAGSIGDTVTLTIQGNELQGVTAVQFNPDTGLTVGSPVPAADGKSVTVQVTIATSAPLTLRAVKVLAGTTSIPFSDPNAAVFRVTLPQPRIDSVEPIVIPIPSTVLSFAVNGINFQNASQVKVYPPDGVTISNPPSVSTDGTRATVSLTVASSAAAGARVVTIVTPAGETSTTATLANTITLTANPGPTYSALAAPLVGVVKEVPPGPPPTVTYDPIAAPIIGVVLEFTPPPPSPSSIFQSGPMVGVAFGPTGIGIDPKGFVAGTSGTLTINGFALDGVSGVAVNPATGITLGAPQPSPDGTQVTVPITVAAGTAIGLREIIVSTAAGRVSFADPAANRLWIAAGVPQLDSISPILSGQGASFTLTIRGSNFQGATAVTAGPPDGIVFGFPLSVDATGAVLTIPMVVRPDAPLGSRVIRVSVPGAISSPDAVPANTFTVYPP